MTRVKGFLTRLPRFSMLAAGLGYDPRRDGGEFILIALLVVLGVDLVAVLAPDDLRRAADGGCA
jgi:hypothetical protein